MVIILDKLYIQYYLSAHNEGSVLSCIITYSMEISLLTILGRSGRKGKKRREESSEEEVSLSTHKVNVAIGEMPEGADLSDGDTKDTSNQASNPHNKLNINLDAPLRDEELIPVRRHREVMEKPAELVAEKPEEKRAKKKRSKKEKEGDEEKSERRREREERRKERGDKEEKSSKKRHQKKREDESDLLAMGEDDETGTNDTVQHKAVPTVPPSIVNDTVEQDDLSFWLDDNKSPPADTNGTAVGASLLPPENGPQPSATPEEESTHRRSHKKHKRDKDKKREKKQPVQEIPDTSPAETTTTTTTTTLVDTTNDILELGFLGGNKKAREELAADANLRILYEFKQNQMYNQQLMVYLTFTSTSPSALTALEFNILDSLSVQVVRPMGVGHRDAIQLPFQLTPGNSQEYQIAFNVNNVVVSQKLKGTLTYMMSSSLGSTSEKLDVRISFPVSAFIHTANFSKNQFMDVLGSGELGEAVTSQTQLVRSTDFNNAVALISNGLHVSVIERVGTGASLYGVTMAQHHVCLLVKDSLQSGISVSVKSSEQILSQSVADEIAKFV